MVVVPKKRKRGRRAQKSKMTKIESTSELEDIKVDVLEPVQNIFDVLVFPLMFA